MFLELIGKYIVDNFVLLVAFVALIYLFFIPNHIVKKDRILLFSSVVLSFFLSVLYFIFNTIQNNPDVDTPIGLQKFLAFILVGGTPVITFFYFYASTGLSRKRLPFTIILAVNGIFALTVFFSDFVLGFDESGKFYTGVFFFFPIFILELFILLSVIYNAIKKSKDKTILSSIILITSVLTALVCSAADDLTYLYIITVILASLVYVYIYYVYDTAYQIKEMRRKQIELAVSQIQPHFIFNALNSIYALTLSDVVKAREVLANFSQYLRVNIDSLSSSEPIEFDKEIDHIKSYLQIEKIRFNERLNVKWDIKFNNFKIAPLTLQPIIENAVRHGICKKHEGGTIFFSTRRDGDDVEIIIQDDGVGFDTNQTIDKTKHAGMSNVRERIVNFYNGSFDLKSEIGVGTTVTIRIPLKA